MSPYVYYVVTIFSLGFNFYTLSTSQEIGWKELLKYDLFSVNCDVKPYSVDQSVSVYICIQRFNAYKYHWSDKRVAVILEVNTASLDQVDPATRRTLCSYDYKDIEGFAVVCWHC